MNYAIINTDNDIIETYDNEQEAYEELAYYNDEYTVVYLPEYLG